jgi:D-3-phosphoglycerate dehydrogenase
MTAQNFSILVCEPMAPQGLALLGAQAHLVVDIALNLTRGELLKKIPTYDALLVRSQTKVDRDVIAAGSRLKLIGRAGVGIDNIDIVEAKARDIAVINTPSGNSISAAELAFALMLALARNIPAAHMTMQQGLWARKHLQGNEVFGKTLGLIGFGNVGQNVAARAIAFGMRVVSHDPWIAPSQLQNHGVSALPLPELLSVADFVSLHCGLSDDTRNMINDQTIRAMKKGASLINTARGELIDDDALLKGLDSGHLHGAALDVFRQEPPDPADPLLHHDKIIATPHLGASTEEAQLRVSTLLAEQTIAFFAGSTNVTRAV